VRDLEDHVLRQCGKGNSQSTNHCEMTDFHLFLLGEIGRRPKIVNMLVIKSLRS
jgi:hypothetical protein